MLTQNSMMLHLHTLEEMKLPAFSLIFDDENTPQPAQLNQQAIRLLYPAIDTTVTTIDFKLIDKTSAWNIVGILQHCIKTCEPGQFEFRFKQGNATFYLQARVFPVVDEDDGDSKMIIGLLDDLTRQKLTEQSLVETEMRYRHLVDLMPIGFIVHAEGKVLLANQEALRILGLQSPSQIIGKDFLDYVVPENRSGAAEQIETSYEGGYTLPIQQALLRPDGSQVLVEIIESGIEYMGQAAAQSVIRDLENELQVKKLTEQIKREQDLRSFKSRFISMVAHDLRNPMTSIKLSVDLIERYSEMVDEARLNRKLGDIRYQLDLMDDLLEDIVTIGRIEAENIEVDFEVEDIYALCEVIIKDVQRHLGKDHNIVFVTDGSPLYMQVDTRLFGRVIMNLLQNAVKYSDKGSVVQFVLDVHNPQGFMVIHVIDEGIGIPEVEVATIFDLFQRASNVGQRKGTGLGLAIVKEIVELHGGTLDVYSELGVGTTFTVMVPLATVENA